ncbi:MAG: heavy metal sensor signal transduction histidine kinase [Bryobacterales bacterium]|nr:heavy metal sensor signal transduction histidine kinase [Bryobacterales bacterium]
MRHPVNLLRGLRFRLTLSYLLLFSALLVVIGLYFRHSLQVQTEGDVRAVLEEVWGEAKGYLRIENERPIWTADPEDPEDSHIVERLRYVILLTDSSGNILIDSPNYESIGIDSLSEIRRIMALREPEVHVRSDAAGRPYIIKAGVMLDDHGKRYFFAIGRSLAESQRTVDLFTADYFLSLLAIIPLTGLLGWALAGRAIQPVNELAQAAQKITGSNLSLQIPLRGAGDELDHLIESFNRMTTRLEDSFEQIRRFSTDVSHELRTPLTAIRGQLEVALFTAKTPEQYHDAMVNALEDVEQLSSIVRALLLLSQAESGQLVLQKTVLDLGQVAEDIVDQFQIPAEEKHVRLTARIEPGVVILADRTQIERLFSNLLSNAVKYTPQAGTVHVRVRRDERQNWGRIEIEDTGVGIPEENLPHIFDRFYRVRNAETNLIQGLGLGLSFVAWIVKAHGGQIGVTSTVGAGTRFTIRLPAEAPATQPVNEDHGATVERL